MKIGLDFDGVLSDCGKLKCEAAKRLYGLDIPPEQMKKELLIESGQMTYEQYRWMQSLVYGTREVGLTMDPVPGMLDFLPKLLRSNDIKIITSRGEPQAAIAKEWCQKLNLDIEFVPVGYGISKKAAAEGLDVYIDDDLEKVVPMIGQVPNLFLFSWGYNEHTNHEKVTRIKNWEEFFNKVTSLHES